jgi:hypothetical protein
VEKSDPDTVALSNCGQRTLGAIEIPQTGKDSPVFIAVAVADHNLLYRLLQAQALLLVGQAALRQRVRQNDSRI